MVKRIMMLAKNQSTAYSGVKVYFLRLKKRSVVKGRT